MKKPQSKATRSEVAPKSESQQATSRNDTNGSNLIEFQMPTEEIPVEEQTTWDANIPDAAGRIVKTELASDEERVSIEMYRLGLNNAEKDLRRMAKSMHR
ncbi:hypothetical protein MLD52_04095 [Puniceicoccaceae bacterium K14]|nr:hypothetical protein [Puniceicoccaceae bacterium K14]